MNELATIICDNIDLRLIDKLPIINYQTERIGESETPVMVIGYEYMKKLYSDKDISILNHIITDNIMWCFSPREKRVNFEECLLAFYEQIVDNVDDKTTYFFVNPFEHNSPIGFKNWFEYTIPENNIVYLDEELFLYIKVKNDIFGFNIDDLEYFDIPIEQVKDLLYKKHSKIIYNLSFLPNDFKNIIRNRKYLVPQLFEIFENENRRI